MAKLFAIEVVALSSCKFVVPVSDIGLRKITKMKPAKNERAPLC